MILTPRLWIRTRPKQNQTQTLASCCDVFRVGVAVCRHLRRLLPVLLGYLEVGDPPEESVRLKMLEVLQSTIRLAWPR